METLAEILCLTIHFDSLLKKLLLGIVTFEFREGGPKLILGKIALRLLPSGLERTETVKHIFCAAGAGTAFEELKKLAQELVSRTIQNCLNLN